MPLPVFVWRDGVLQRVAGEKLQGAVYDLREMRFFGKREKIGVFAFYQEKVFVNDGGMC